MTVTHATRKCQLMTKSFTVSETQFISLLLCPTKNNAPSGPTQDNYKSFNTRTVNVIARPFRDGQPSGNPFCRPGGRGGAQSTGEGGQVQVLVRDNNVDQALKALKKKMQREGIFREMKLRRHYEKPSERRAREAAEAVRRARKMERKRLEREGF